MILRPVPDLWGSATIIESNPASAVARDAVYVPLRPGVLIDEDKSWGLYRADGSLLPEAAYLRLPAKYLVGQSWHRPVPDGATQAPPGNYVYAGPMIRHYGHFITAFLPRLWQIVEGGLDPSARIVSHSQYPLEEWFAFEPARAMLAALGLGPERFWIPQEPVRFKRISVPRPAMEEQTFAHRVLHRLGTCIGATMAAPEATPMATHAPGRRIYLSKGRIQNGTFMLAEEGPFETVMRAAGLEIVYPETLPFAEQVQLFSEASLVVGTVGSALHTTLFCGRPVRIVGLAYGPVLNANLAIMDRLCGNQATYLFPATGLSEEKSGRSLFTFRLDDAAAIARELTEHF